MCSLVIGLGKMHVCVEITDLFTIPPGLLTVLSAGDLLVVCVHTNTFLQSTWCALRHQGFWVTLIIYFWLVTLFIFPFPELIFLIFQIYVKPFDRCFPK